MKTNRTKILSTTALIAVLCMQLFWMWNSFEMTVHQMGFETPWNLAPDVRAQALLAAFYESKFTVLTSLLTTVVIILYVIYQKWFDDGKMLKPKFMEIKSCHLITREQVTLLVSNAVQSKMYIYDK